MPMAQDTTKNLIVMTFCYAKKQSFLQGVKAWMNRQVTCQEEHFLVQCQKRLNKLSKGNLQKQINLKTKSSKKRLQNVTNQEGRKAVDKITGLVGARGLCFIKPSRFVLVPDASRNVFHFSSNCSSLSLKFLQKQTFKCAKQEK